jgi:Spy/CpxP family protein refolding chaperone
MRPGVLGLSPDQEKAIHALLDKHRQAGHARHTVAADREEALQAALSDPGATPSQIRALGAQVHEARMEEALDRHALVVEIQALLTPAQQAKARSIREAFERERAAHRTLVDALGEPSPGGVSLPPAP